MKTYSKAPDAHELIDKIQSEYHPDLDGVAVAALFVFDEEASSDQVLKHKGYPAAAVCRITPLRDRAQGLDDASIVIDRATWVTLTQPQREALIDHELTHLTRVLDEETEQPKSDVLGRPKLAMRHHDHQFGWFDEIAQRHGEASPEVRQAKALMESSGPLYFDFGPAARKKAPAEKRAH
jgi:hypothetical protein